MYIITVVFSSIVLAIIGIFVLVASRPSESRKMKVEKIYDDEYRKRLEYERHRNELIDHYASFACDMVPYDDPDYSAKVTKMAEHLADEHLELDDIIQEAAYLHEGKQTETELETEELPW
jgi:hypothetical protein